MKAYFVSDLHLVDVADKKSQLFIHWLDDLTKEDGVTHLFLVGDIFDLWIGDHAFFKKKWEPITSKLAALKNAGVDIHYFEGNHDLHLAKYWRDQLGVSVHPDSFDLEIIPGCKLRVEHGDLIDPDDKGYLFLRRCLRTPVITQVLLHLPEWFVTYVGQRMSKLSRAYTSAKSKQIHNQEICQRVRNFAERRHAESAFDFLITGHVHVRDDWKLPSGARSINLGSWFEDPAVLLLHAPEPEPEPEPELKSISAKFKFLTGALSDKFE